MKQIAQAEAVRRKAVYDAAKAMFEPILGVLRTAIAAGGQVSLSLYPPNHRNSDVVSGTLRCRSFHAGVGKRLRRYLIEISPREKSCEVWLDYDLSDDEYEQYVQQYGEAPGRGYQWARTYHVAGRPSMADLKQDIEEALITQLAEREGGLERVRLSSN